MDLNEKRKAIHEAISDAVSEADSQVVTGWALVYETIDEDGDRDLKLLSSDATGMNILPEWSGTGWLRYGFEELEWDMIESEEVPDEELEDD